MKNIEIIGMPMKYGCFLEGTDLSYDYLKDSLERGFNTTCKKKIDASFDKPKEHKNDEKIKYLEPVMEINKRLYKNVYNSIENDNIPIIIGGDHSSCVGSISAALDYYKGDVSVIYIDKHADIHNEKTTPSGNIHGMPLSVCIGRCDERFDIGSFKLKPENLYFIGLGNFEQEEIDYINEANIYHKMESEVNKNTIENIVDEILSKIKTKYVHISFDFDVIKDEDFHAVNVAVENTYQDDKGISYSDALKIFETLLPKVNLSSMDIVEYNPLLDEDGIYKEKAEKLFETINKNIKK